MRKGLDPNKLRFVPVSDVPPVVRRGRWREIFERIPKGQALVINEDEASYMTVKSSLRGYQKKGEFESLVLSSRKDQHTGKRTVYVLNPD